MKEKFTEKLKFDPNGCRELILASSIFVSPFQKIARFTNPEEGLRAVRARAPQAEALAASWIERARPYGIKLYVLRRRIATVSVLVATGLLFVHVMFGVNGMVIYKQKRSEYQTLRKQIDQVQQENDRYTRQIQGLRSDQRAVEKEAREQLGYAKPGEVVYVSPAAPANPANHTAKK